MSDTTQEAPARPTLAEESRRRVHDRVLDALGELLGEKPWPDVSMAAIAARAGVSRQTVYNSFGSRQELAQAYVMREGDRFVVAVSEAVRSHADDPRAALQAALELFLVAIGPHPLVRAITTGEGGEELLPLVTTRSGALVDFVTGELARVIDETWPGLAPGAARELSDTLVRLALSHAALPGLPPKKAAEQITRVLGPHLDELVGSLER